MLASALAEHQEWAELERNGLNPNPNRKDETQFEEAVAEVYHRLAARRAAADGTTTQL